MPTLRKAVLDDVPALFAMINHYAAEGVMLSRTLAELSENVREFTVAEEAGRVVGCGALKSYTGELAEIRSLCVTPGVESCGLGRALVERLLAEAGRYGLKTVFALTLAPSFFSKLGFREGPRQELKIQRDCVCCEKRFLCEEKTLLLDLTRRAARQAAPRVEAAQVPA